MSKYGQHEHEHPARKLRRGGKRQLTSYSVLQLLDVGRRAVGWLCLMRIRRKKVPIALMFGSDGHGALIIIVIEH